ncbi:sensor histidine kinase [Leptospira sp. 'Mane']|uniref:sensor histidine kinase n=1 Tax=Leptospira sp. 'Mane' TaxID=3387407 RepID=UPI00398B78F3
MIFAVAWLTLTVSLGIWWWILGLRQARTIAEITKNTESAQELQRVDRMLQLEGSFFLGMLTLGGVTLAWLSYRDFKRAKLISDFFTTVTHEMRTPLASLQLQIEGLIQDNRNKPILVRYEKLLKENKRIESRMEKAFYLASLMQGEKLYIETFSLQELIASVGSDYPGLIIDPLCNVQTQIIADKRAIESILQNLIENASLHGKATSIRLDAIDGKDKKIHLSIKDNGTGFSGNIRNLTKPFVRHTRTSGTGIGLYIAKNLLKKMGGRLSLSSTNEGFTATLEVKKQIL